MARTKEVPEQYLMCRMVGHAWDRWENSEWVPEFGEALVLRCLRCETERRDSINYLGGLAARSYDYPDDYYIEKGHTPKRDEIRRQFLRVQSKTKQNKGRKVS